MENCSINFGFDQVEKLFRKSVEFCNEVDTWKLNVAHVLFMQVKESQIMLSLCYHYQNVIPIQG